MQTIQIRNRNTNCVIFEGIYNSERECIEDAIAKNITLDYADLRFKNLACINIDSAQLNYVDFSNSNLNHANISEASLQGVNFENASLVGACLAESNMSGANFSGVEFGGTQIAGAIMNSCKFTTLSALTLPFQDTLSMQLCVFTNNREENFSFSRRPIIVSGLGSSPLAILENTILLGHKPLPLDLRSVLQTLLFGQQTKAQALHNI